MTAEPDKTPAPATDPTIELLLRSLRRKEGNWVQWGQACQKLQKSGYTPQAIFEETGFEPIQQNQIMVAAQVYSGLEAQQASETVLDHFAQRGSDSLYELRILSQVERVAAAEFLVAKTLDSEGAYELAKAIKEFSRLTKLPEGFSDHPGDTIAYQCWKNARQKSDLQERSRLIAKGLSFAHSVSARQQIEKLLTDFSVSKALTAPRLPLYRPDEDTESPRIIPVAGKMPITKADFMAVPMTDEIGKFRLVKFSGTGVWVAIPSWQVILEAEDAIALIVDSEYLIPDNTSEEILVIVDRSQRQWRADSYFLVESEGSLIFQWFPEAPSLPILGRMILVLRPKKVLDEDFRKDLWQLEE
ncbi:hypothetical protein Syn7502_03586 [Synechococcus sp. PCC 7502]|uniref:RuBisCO accumulation factor 1 n=1 Tax=Synechococcus sp. PCC 7502 TaxID=1173263 RepID=UPI00029FB6D1|nr:RuBisCO accumulation factor 1 [Synechococcus sp. PCC 7502]AFY75423.1 hypothetical protein Syn7502_03586 [Synechococcus sp. PCC 7502]